MAEKHRDGPARLSRLQKWLLEMLYDAHMAAALSSDELTKLWVQQRGTPFRIRNTNRTQQAAISRALRRLEKRGLVLRQNDVNGSVPDSGHLRLRRDRSEAHTRTTSVQLLPAGVEAVKRLTTQDTPKC